MPRKTRPRIRQAVRPRPERVPIEPPEASGGAATTSASAPVSVRPSVAPRIVGYRPVGGSADYSYVLRDLARIAVIATLILGGMVAVKLAVP